MCATNYREQIQFLEQVYNEERTYQIEEERKKHEALYGTTAQEESKVKEPTKPAQISSNVKIYRNRISRLNDQLDEDSVDKEDHII